MDEILLAIDLSTTCTGYAVFNAQTHELLESGRIKGKTFKDTSKLRATLKKMEHMAVEVMSIVENFMPTYIVIEEIAGSSNRLGQKTLDMQHGILLQQLEPYLDIVSFYDVTGSAGWRTHLGLRLSDADKQHNKDAKRLNKNVLKGTPLIPIIGPKHLACQFANDKFGTTFDFDQNKTDADEADAVSMGYAFCKTSLTKP